MAKQIVYGDEARNKLVEGIDAVANAVKVTLGPAARTVVLEKSWGSPTIINDGVTIAKDIELEDAFANMGAKLIQEVASKTQDNAGDGTSTASVMTQALVHQGMRNVTAGASPVALKSGFDAAIAAVVEHLKGSAIEVDSGDMIRQVATIAANNDPEIGALIAEAFDKVGREGVITVEDSKSMETELEVVDGMEFDKGYVSPYMVTDQERREAVLEAPLVLMTDQSINSTQELIPVLEYAMQQKRPLLIVAKDVEGQALATLVINVASKVLKACVVKAPGFGDEQGEMLDDIAILTGGAVITKDKGGDLQAQGIASLGTAEKVIVTKNKTTLIGGGGDEAAVGERVELLRGRAKLATSKWDREKIEKRVGKLGSGVAVLKIGAATETEAKETKARVDDAPSPAAMAAPARRKAAHKAEPAATPTFSNPKKLQQKVQQLKMSGGTPKSGMKQPTIVSRNLGGEGIHLYAYLTGGKLHVDFMLEELTQGGADTAQMKKRLAYLSTHRDKLSDAVSGSMDVAARRALAIEIGQHTDDAMANAINALCE